jgi:hypothetical protein
MMHDRALRVRVPSPFRAATHALIPSFLLTLFTAGMGVAQTTPTQIQIGTNVTRAAVRPFGMNVTEQNFWDAGQIHKNLIFRNPGFEPMIYQSVMRCVSGSATSCSDDSPWAVWPAGFWTGGRYELISRGQTIRSGTISAHASGVYTFADSGVAPATGDVIVLRKRFIGDATNASTGWWPSASGGAAITSETTDLPPGTQGAQCIRLNALAAGSNVNLVSYFDSSPGATYVQLNGAYRIQFKAKGVGGANQIRVSVSRGATNFVSRTLTLTTQWQDYTVDFSASETGSSIGTANLTFNVSSGSSALVDDVNFFQSSSDPSNTTTFRDPVVRALQTLKPGTLRYWAENLGESLDNMIAPVWGRQRAGYRISYNTREDVTYGLHEFLELCQHVGADPWVVVPLVYSPQEAANLIEYLSGPSTSPYGARRAARGRTAPWTDTFTQVHLEFGNEAWNGVFRGGTIEYPEVYGARAQTIFGAMRSASYFQASKYDLVLGGQAVWIGRNQTIQSNCNNNDSVSIAPYMMYDVNNYANNEELFGPLFAEAEMNSRNGVSRQNRTMLNAFGRPIQLAAYEMNLHTTGGSISQAALDQFIPSAGTGLGVTSSMLQMLRDLDMRIQNFYSLQQSFYGRPDGRRVKLWGAVVDMGVSDRRRPQYLALQLVNNAMAGSDLVATTHSGPDPTWEQPLVNGVQLSGAHYLQSFAFRQGSRYKLVLYNLHRSSALPVNFGGSAMPSGNVTIERYSSSQITDNNETAENVRITTQTAASFNPSAAFSLPPYSLTVLTWDSGGAPPPTNPPPALAISGVTASNVTASSASIVWVTTQTASSQVIYGPPPPLALNTPLDSNLVTTHTVNLTGLTAGTTYNYQVRSTNASGTVTSSTLQFTTATGTPTTPTTLTMSGVTTSGITTTGFTFSWTTNAAATSQVTCTSTAAATVATPYTTVASTTHSVAISGLNPATAYSCVAQSRTSDGGAVSSLPMAMTTLTPPPTAITISGVSASSITTSGLVLGWTTNVAATSQVECSSASAATVTTPYTTTAATTHSVAVSGLTAGTSYSCLARSRSTGGVVALSSPVAVTTLSPAGLTISGVSASSITSSGFIMAWTTNVAATSQVACTSATATAVTTAYTTTAATTHRIQVSGLTASATYSCIARSRNSAGTVTNAPAIPVVTSADAASPSGGAAITWIGNWGQTKSSITISWATSVATAGYVEYGTVSGVYPLRTTAPTALALGQTINLTGLSNGTQYFYRVRVKNSAGVETISAVQTFKTLDQEAPVISNIRVTILSATSAQVTWTTNEPCIGAVQYGATTSYTGWAGSSAGTATQHAAVLNNLPRGVTNYRVWTKDSFDNVGLSANLTLTMP